MTKGIFIMSIEIVDSLKRKAHFIINKAEIQKLVDIELQKHAKKAKIDGFRPGKAPKNVIEKMYGGMAYEDALNELINKNFINLIVENEIDLVGYPEFDIINKDDKNATDFMFCAMFEVIPTIKIVDIGTYEIEKPFYNLTESDVNRTIDMLRKNKATYLTKDNTIAQNGNKVTIDFKGTVDGNQFEGGTATDYTFTLGEKQMLPDFEAGVVGLVINETKVIEVRFPYTYHAEDLKGKTAQFEITLKKIEEAEIPDLNPEIIKEFGIADGTIETLHKEINKNLSHTIKQNIHHKTREAVLNALLKHNQFEIPQALVHDEIHTMMNAAKEKMINYGYPKDKIQLTHEMFEADAKRFAMLKLLIRQIIKDHDIKVSDEETRAAIEDMAQMYDDAEDYIKWYYEDKDRVQNANAIAMENKVIATILKKAVVKDIEVVYEDLMNS